MGHCHGQSSHVISQVSCWEPSPWVSPNVPGYFPLPYGDTELGYVIQYPRKLLIFASRDIMVHPVWVGEHALVSLSRGRDRCVILLLPPGFPACTLLVLWMCFFMRDRPAHCGVFVMPGFCMRNADPTSPLTQATSDTPTYFQMFPRKV